MKMLEKIKKETIFGIIALLFVPIAAFLLLEFYGHNPFEEVREKAMWFNICLFELIAWILFCITGRVRTALRIELFAAMVFGLANTYVVKFRTNPIVPWDFLSIRTAVSVAGNYDLMPNGRMILVTLFFLLLMVGVQFVTLRMPAISWKKDRIDWKENGKRFLYRFVPAVLLFTVLTGFARNLQDEDFQTRNYLYPFLFTPAHMTNVNGIAVTFTMNLAYMSIEQPEGYDREEVEKLLASYESEQMKEESILENESFSENKTDSMIENENETFQEHLSGNMTENGEILLNKQMPNIIVVMNEAFSDMASVTEFSTNEDYMPFFHSLQKGAENTITGNLQVSVCGGNTANSEFEFLTGNTMAFLPQGSIPYQQYLRNEIPSIPLYLKELGYDTVATHPYHASGWDRDTIYPLLGFERSIFIDEYDRREKIRSYISDAACVDKIIEVYEEKEEGVPLFLFNVTMQNHGGYTEEFADFTPNISVEGLENLSVEQYLSLLKVSDAELERLVSYFSQTEEDTIIVFFGDHQPNDAVAGPLLKLNGISVKNLTNEELLNRYEVPYLIWANFDIKESVQEDTSLNYLGGKVLKAAGIEPFAYQNYLLELEKEYPVISAMQVQKADGSVTNWQEEKQGLRLYQSIQYYYLFDYKQ